MKTQQNSNWMTKIKALVIATLTIGLVLSTMATTVTANVYSDVNDRNTHYDNIIEADKLGFMTGYPDNTFRPYAELPRGNVVKALGKYVIEMSGEDLDSYDVKGVEPFSDVPASYADPELYQYSLVVKDAGIFAGSNNKLMPNNFITRQQMAKVLVNAFDLDHIQGVASEVTDHDQADPVFREYIDILSKNKVTTVTKYNPRAHTIRGQFATFLISAHHAKTNASKGEEAPKDDPKEESEEKPDWLKEFEDRIKEDANEPEVVEPPAEPVSVEEFLPQTYHISTSDPKLPSTAKVTYTDHSVKEHAVTWKTAGIDFTEVGEHNIIGQVEGTNLIVTLPLEMKYIEAIMFPPKPPNLIVIPIEGTGEPEVEHARSLMNALPQEVKNADNALIASQKWGLAEKAVHDVNIEYPAYTTTHWDTILSEQWQVIEQRQTSINKAKNSATVAMSRLASELTQVESASDVELIINNAKIKLLTYEELDKLADTTSLRNTFHKYEAIGDDLEIVLEAVADKKMNLIVLNFTADKPNYQQITPEDNRVQYEWDITKGSKHVNTSTKTLLRDNRFLGFDIREVTFKGSAQRGSVTVSKEFEVFISPTSKSIQIVVVNPEITTIKLDD